jgi:hypothetical protein
MITVRFNSEGEFIDELKAGPPCEKIVRVTKSFELSQTLPIQNITVLATAVRDGRVIRLSRYVGQRFANRFANHEDEVSRRVDETAEKIMAEIEAAAKELGLEVRAGVYE